LVLVAGCVPHYYVRDSTLDAVATLPRTERDTTLVPAERGADGPTVYLRAKDLKPRREMHGDKRRVRTWRGASTVGWVLLAEGLVLVSIGLPIALLATRPCAGDDCEGNAAAAVIGGSIAGVGGGELIVGGSLLGMGKRSFEVPSGQRGFTYLP
jgi:hypothetical protein